MDFRNPVNILPVVLVITGLIISMIYTRLNPGQMSPYNMVPLILTNPVFMYLEIGNEVEKSLFSYYIGFSFSVVAAAAAQLII